MSENPVSTRPDELEITLRRWMSSRGTTRPPETMLQTVGARIDRTRQRPALIVRPWLSGNTLPRPSLLVPVIALLLALVLVVGSLVVGARLLRGDDQSTLLVAPSPTPATALTPLPSSPAGVQNGAIVLLIYRNTDQAGVAQVDAVSIALNGERTILPIPVQSRSCPTFSPDGKHLAYIAEPDTGSVESLAVSDPDGSNRRDLWAGTFNAQTFHQVIWSRDSSRVAATLALTGTSPDAQDRTVIGYPDGRGADLLPSIGGEYPGQVSWNGADLDQLAEIDASHLAVLDIRDGSTRQVAPEGAYHAVAWSADGKTIAYTAKSTPEATNNDLIFINADGSHRRVIGANGGGSEGLLAWSPNGRLLAVKVDGGGAAGTFAIRLVDAEGNEVRTLGPFPASSNFSFTWSPDSLEILLALGGTGIGAGETGPLIAPVDGSEPRTIGVRPGEYYTQCPLAWQPVLP